jgi:hypothetical protein
VGAKLTRQGLAEEFIDRSRARLRLPSSQRRHHPIIDCVHHTDAPRQQARIVQMRPKCDLLTIQDADILQRHLLSAPAGSKRDSAVHDSGSPPIRRLRSG